MAAVPQLTFSNGSLTAPSRLQHGLPFDPTHGYGLEELLKIDAPEEVADFADFWNTRRQVALHWDPQARLHDTGVVRNGWRVLDLSYMSTGSTKIQGWVLVPAQGEVKRGLVVGHGYGGRLEPDFNLPVNDAVLFFPCARGLGRSSHPSISALPQWHVLHDIEDRSRYVLGGCVDDLWMAVTAMVQLFPQVVGHIGYMGISFGGGIGTMAAAWEDRLGRAHFNVPTFGNQPLRMQLPSVGSAASVQQHVKSRPDALEVLRYFDAAVAARHMRVPVHLACAMFDPAVAPAGQFAIYNALPGPKHLFVLTAGHHPHPGQELEEQRLRQELHTFFEEL
ncbi:MAG: acetylxylan esterase [Verrucomicrobium sp.]|nr:acetylxylan esterase [Verrucomicrobium sp.]